MCNHWRTASSLCLCHLLRRTTGHIHRCRLLRHATSIVYRRCLLLVNLLSHNSLLLLLKWRLGDSVSNPGLNDCLGNCGLFHGITLHHSIDVWWRLVILVCHDLIVSSLF